MISKLRDLLSREEGRRSHAYQDHLGYWTIGVGRCIDQRVGGGLSDPEIDSLLDNDITRFLVKTREALPWFDDLDEARQAVLVAMAFQMGVQGLLSFKQTLSAIAAGDYAHAADRMLQSKWAQQTPARAKRMAEMMRTGTWPQ